MTNRYDDVRVAPDPVLAEDLRRRLHARLAARPEDRPNGGREEIDERRHSRGSWIDDASDETDKELSMLLQSDDILMRNDNASTPRPSWRLGVVAASALLIAGGIAILASTRPNEDAGAPATVDDSVPTRDAQHAVGIAQRFVEARNSWDADTVRSLLADDAVIDDSGVATADDYPARVELERIRGWSFREPQCTTSEIGPPSRVTCTYTMEDALTRALGVGPFTGSSFEFVIANERIQAVTHDFDFSQYSPQAFDVMWQWLDATHPGDTGVMWQTDASGYASPTLTPEALALLERRIREFVAVAPAIRFIDARNARDGETVRSLLADDVVIHDFAVATADDYLARIEFERIVGWRFLQPQCTTTNAGSPIEVTCTYTMENNWSRALGAGPFTGSRFEFAIADASIEQVTHHFDITQYSPEVFEVVTAWLAANHPDDIDTIFEIDADGNWTPMLTPRALALMEQHSPEFVTHISNTDAVLNAVSETVGCTMVPVEVTAPAEDVPAPNRSLRCESNQIIILVHEYDSLAALNEMIHTTDYCYPHGSVGPVLIEAISPALERTEPPGVMLMPADLREAVESLGGAVGRC